MIHSSDDHPYLPPADDPESDDIDDPPDADISLADVLEPEPTLVSPRHRTRAFTQPRHVPPSSLIPASVLAALPSAHAPEPLYPPPRPVDLGFVLLRLTTLVVLCASFTAGTLLLRPRAAAPEPRVAAPPQAPLERPAPPPPPSPAITPAIAPAIAIADAPPPPPPPAIPADPPVADPDFDYDTARALVEEQHAFLRTECLTHKARVPLKSIKFRVDVRPGGRAKVAVYSSDSGARACVRGLFSFPFGPSPRGGAFEYTLTPTSSTSRPVAVDPRTVK